MVAVMGRPRIGHECTNGKAHSTRNMEVCRITHDLFSELAAEVQTRLEDEQPGAPSRYLFLYGLQRARDLWQEEMGFGGFGGFGEEPAAAMP